MRYSDTVRASFLERPNRFIARVGLGDETETVHVKNTGRCRELLISGAEVALSKATGTGRKTAYDLIAVYKDGLGWVNIDSQAPNAVVREWLESRPEMFADYTLLRPEYSRGNSRVDFYMECPDRRILIEVKGCTLEIGGVGYFPDAPTKRGVKHLYELSEASRQGFECYIAFVIAMPGVRTVRPNGATDPEFERALDNAEKSGVRVLYLPCRVGPDALEIDKT